ncbi:hypothetical protein CDAR_567171 [Caerostris darwini]|uniref:C2H2-type domain-containing protein n=1 Tax=Caerostris darwini TaxID=1538125 RepID=A0AAV4QZ42_9ARAC|nr:hypothetical protein CDAR_567171 [Caerostris darwini]
MLTVPNLISQVLIEFCMPGHDLNWPSVHNYVACQTISAPSCTDLGNLRTDCVDSLIDNDVGIAMDELLHNILPCTPPPATQPRVTCHSSSPSTIIQIEDSESVLPHPRPSCDSPSTIVVIEDDKDCAEPLGLCQDTVVDEVALYPSDLEVRELFPYSPLCQRFDFMNLTCIECRRRFFSVGGLENHLFAVHVIRLDNSNDSPSTSGHTTIYDVIPPPELISLGPTTGPPKRTPVSKLSPAKTWVTVTSKPNITTSQPIRPSRAIRGVAQSSLSAAPPPTKTVRKQISFNDSQDNPDEVTHVVLMPTKPLTKQKDH